MSQKSMQIVTVLANEAVAQNIFRLTLSAPQWAEDAHAGHFVNIHLPMCGEIIWRRPFSVHRVDRERGTIDVLYAAIGRGSQALSRMRAGEALNIIGLLGNSFTPDVALRHAILVAGGLGIAPFMLLLQDLVAVGCKTIVFYGVRSAPYLYGVTEMQSFGAEVMISTEDGSYGEKGLVTEALENYLSGTPADDGRSLFACGPTPMLQRLQQLLQTYPMPAQVTVENIMACGFGACVGCAVQRAQPRADGQTYALACKDGPVFSLQEIVFHA